MSDLPLPRPPGHPTESEAIKLLGERLKPEGWVTLPQVANTTGAGAQRYADAVQCQIYPSRGIQLRGIEYKRSRGDWLRELKDPTKTEPIQRFCHGWIVLAPKGLISSDEIPETWGLFEIAKGKLYRTKAPPKLTPEPLHLGIVASILRRASESSPHSEALFTARREGYDQGARHAKTSVEHEIRRLREIEAKLDAFEKASGVSIRYDYKLDATAAEFGRAIKGPRNYAETVRDMQGRARGLVRMLDESVAELEKNEAPGDEPR